jgi:pimeloyl-ACP methyl ester carboxylesterase
LQRKIHYEGIEMKKEMLVDDTPVSIEGTGQDTIVMLHGWPDTHELWQQQIDCFKDNYVCVSFTMPIATTIL